MCHLSVGVGSSYKRVIEPKEKYLSFQGTNTPMLFRALFGKRETSNFHCDEQETVCHKWLDVTYYVSVATVACRYNAVQYNIISHTPVKWFRQNINQSLNIQKTSQGSPVPFIMILEKIDHAKPASHYISLYWHMMKPCLGSYYPDECHFNRQSPRVI